ncbi:MAG: CNNM domain-containing protein [Planctomycetota bacterium]|jgi:CBS domain containing-hemolysin-like protein
MVNSTILILVAIFVVILSGLFAGAETGMYKLSRLRLRLGIEKKRLSSVLLGKCVHDSSALLFSMLVGNKLFRIEGTHTAELSATLITAPVLLVFGELIPKNVFFYRADVLMPLFAPVLYVFHKLFTWCGVVPALKFVSGIFARLTGTHGSVKAMTSVVEKAHIKTIMAETQEEGILSSVQTDIINRLVGISHISIRTVMIPLQKVEMVDVDSNNSVLLNKLKECAFTRLLVTDKERTNIVGFISVYETLGSGEKFTDLRDFTRPIRRLHAQTTVLDAMNIMQRENQRIVLVTRMARGGRVRPIGIVTMKDVIEELIGELTEW